VEFPDQDKVEHIGTLIARAEPSNIGDVFEEAVSTRKQIGNAFALRFAEVPLQVLRGIAARAKIGWPLFANPPRPSAALSDSQTLQLIGVEMALHELCYCCERLQESADITSGGSSSTRFYINGVYYYVTSLFLVDKTKPSHDGLPMGGTIVMALHPIGLAHLLAPIDAILNMSFGTALTFGDTIRKLRNVHLVHGDFSPEKFEFLVADSNMRDPAQQERLAATIWDLFYELLLLDLKVTGAITDLNPNIPAIISRYAASHP